jgi:hypothetical protein
LGRNSAIWHHNNQHQPGDKVHADQAEQQRSHDQKQQRAAAQLLISRWLG